MRVSSKERRRFDEKLSSLMEKSQRSLVSLRRCDYDNLSLDIEELVSSINAFIVEAGGERL